MNHYAKLLSLIESCVTRAKEGATVTETAATVLRAIVGDVAQVATLLDGITQASNEQAKGVEQVCAAVSQIDKVTQQNAAGAEESAAAAQELSTQARNVNAMVEALGRAAGRAEMRQRKTARVQVSGRANGEQKTHGANCWEVKKCGRTPGGKKVAEMGVCPAYPDHGRDCWAVAGTFCGGKVQGRAAQKLASCMECDFYQTARDAHAVAHA